MKFENFYSSSAGNLYRVTSSGGRQLLLECGVTWRRLLKAIGHELSTIDGVLLTHEHQDHSKAVESVVEAGLDLYSSHGTLCALDMLNEHRSHIVIDGHRLKIGDEFEVMPFMTYHDCAEPLGFIVHDRVSKENLFFATDTCRITQRFGLAFEIIAIECSYDVDMVKRFIDESVLPEIVAKRLLSSHMDWEATLQYLKFKCYLNNCREIHLLHMSKTSLDAPAIVSVFENEFMRDIYWR